MNPPPLTGWYALFAGRPTRQNAITASIGSSPHSTARTSVPSSTSHAAGVPVLFKAE